MKRGVLALLGLLLVLSFAAAGCTKTVEKLFTAKDECKTLKEYDDPENFRDDYDNCLLFTEEEYSSTEGCKKTCKAYCEKNEMAYQDILIDFSGCHCYCSYTMSTSREISGYVTHFFSPY